MILIVADTGPLNYLIQIGCVDLLSELVETAVLPDSVLRELKSENAPFKVREWAENLPTWVEVRATNMFISDELIAQALRRDSDRRGV